MTKYRKFFVALSGVFAVLGAALADGAVSTEEVLALVGAAFAAFGVYRVPNAQ